MKISILSTHPKCLLSNQQVVNLVLLSQIESKKTRIEYLYSCIIWTVILGKYSYFSILSFNNMLLLCFPEFVYVAISVFDAVFRQCYHLQIHHSNSYVGLSVMHIHVSCRSVDPMLTEGHKVVGVDQMS